MIKKVMMAVVLMAAVQVGQAGEVPDNNQQPRWNQSCWQRVTSSLVRVFQGTRAREHFEDRDKKRSVIMCATAGVFFGSTGLCGSSPVAICSCVGSAACCFSGVVQAGCAIEDWNHRNRGLEERIGPNDLSLTLYRDPDVEVVVEI